MSEIEDRLRVAMQDAVADEEMPGYLVGLVMRRQWRRRALAGGVAVLAALTVAVPGAIAWRDAKTPTPQRATLAARILSAASAAVGRARVTAEPSARQWIYAQSVHYEYNTGTLIPGCRFVSSGGKPGETQECAEWTRFDGNATAYWQGRHLVVTTNSTPWPAEKKGDLLLGPFNSPEAAYAALASLPKNPHALLAAADKAAKALGPILGVFPGRGSSLVGAYLMMLMWEADGIGPPEGEAAVFQAMAALPGVKVQQGITDIAGAQAIGVSAGGFEQLLLDPVSYQVIGLREFNPIGGPKPGWPRHGALIISSAYTQVSEVRGPGIR